MSLHEPTDREKGYLGLPPGANANMNEYRAGRSLKDSEAASSIQTVDADGLALAIAMVASVIAPLATGWIVWSHAPQFLWVIAVSYAVMVLLLRRALPLGEGGRLGWARAARYAAFAWLLGWLAVSLAMLADAILTSMRAPQFMPALQWQGTMYGRSEEEAGYFLVTSSPLNWLTPILAWTLAACWGLNAKLPAFRSGAMRVVTIVLLILAALSAGTAAMMVAG